MLVKKKLSYMENIPGFLLPHPSSSNCTNFKNIDANGSESSYLHINNQPPAMKIAPSMASLEALLSKLPSVKPPPLQHFATHVSPVEVEVEVEKEEDRHGGDGIGGSVPPPPPSLFLLS